MEHQAILRSLPERPHWESAQASPPRDLSQFRCEVEDILHGTMNTVRGAATGQVVDLGRPLTVSALTHIMQICHDFDVANLLQYCAGFAPMLFQWSHSHMVHFLLQIRCNFFTARFFRSRPLFIMRFLFCRAIFHVELVGHCCLFYHLIVFQIDNRYEYILMHFKGSTDLVNSAT